MSFLGGLRRFVLGFESEYDPRIYEAIRLMEFECFGEAAAMLRVLIREYHKAWPLHVLLGICYKHRSRLQEAFDCFSTVIKLDEDKNPNWWFARAQISIELGDLDQALKDARIVNLRDHGSYRGTFLQALVHQERKEFEQAKQLFMRSLQSELDEDSFEVVQAASEFFVSIEENETAFRILYNSISRWPDHGPAYATLAKYYRYMGQPAKAMETLQTLIREVPDDAGAGHLAMAYMFHDFGRHNDAIVAANAAIECNPDVPILYAERANFLAAANRMDECFDDFATAINMHPGIPTFYFERGQSFVKVHNFVEAHTDIVHAIKMHGKPVPSKWREYRAFCNTQLGQTEKARKDREIVFKRHTKRYKEVAAKGVRVLAARVRADQRLFQPQFETLSGLVLLSFDEEAKQSPERIVELAKQISALKGTSHPLAMLPTDHKYFENRRQLIPAELTGGLKVYAADIEFYPEFLSGKCLTEDILHNCIAEPTPNGRIQLVPNQLLQKQSK